MTQDSNNVQGQTVPVGASHRLRLVGVLGPDVLLPMYPGFMPKEPMINKLTKQLEDLILEKSDTVIKCSLHGDYKIRSWRPCLNWQIFSFNF